MKGLALAALLSLAPIPIDTAAAQSPQDSATRARDVDGIELGMTIEQVRNRMPLEHLAFETFRGTSNGIEFDLGFSPGGRVFRIESTQPLGRFQPDAKFAESLSAKLLSKYGPPDYSSLPNGSAHWSLVQPVADSGGEVHPFTVMWANAMLSEDDRGVTLVVTLLDFRILWADQQQQNRAPSQEAAGKIRL